MLAWDDWPTGGQDACMIEVGQQVLGDGPIAAPDRYENTRCLELNSGQLIPNDEGLKRWSIAGFGSHQLAHRLLMI